MVARLVCDGGTRDQSALSLALREPDQLAGPKIRTQRTHLVKHPALGEEEHEMPITEYPFHLRPLRGIQRAIRISLCERGSEKTNGLFDALRFDAGAVLNRERNVLEQWVRVVGESVGELDGASAAGQKGLRDLAYVD